MKKIFIAILLAIPHTGFTESKWDLSEGSEYRLSAALELVKTQKSIHQNKSGANFATVGDDGSCDFRVGANRIQNAVDSGATEIRIASNTTYEENVLINTFATNLSIRGGFADCTEANNNNQSNEVVDRAEITRLNGQVTSVFRIRNLPANIVTTFENLIITGGDSNEQGSGGSVSLSETDSDAVFNNVWLTGANKTFTGGGLSVVSSNSTIILNNTNIFNNAAVSDGGGIYCNDFSGLNKSATIILAQDSSLHSNSTSFNGGGAYLSTGCFLASFTGSSVINDGIGIFNNSSIRAGGGLYAINGANVLIYGGRLCNLTEACFGNTHSPASVYSNRANTDLATNSSGGGIRAEGSGTDVTVIAGYIYDNESGSSGGGGGGGALAIHNFATLNIYGLGHDCWSQDRCNLLSGNAGNVGGAILNADAEVNISHSYFEDNRADFGLVLYSVNNAVSDIDSSVFNNNGNNGIGERDDNYVVLTTHGAKTTIKYSTIADNKAETSVFFIGDQPDTELNLQSSVVDDIDSGDVVNGPLGAINSDCVMAHETTSFTGTNNVVDDPEFIDRAGRNYHLNASNSPAIDFCNVFPTLSNKDIDYQERGYDDLSLSDFIGPYDIGADESYAKTYLTVGGDASCDFNTSTQSIQDAIDTGIEEVRIATNGLHNKTVNITNRDVKIRGGYTDCSAANNDLQTTRTDLIVTIGTLASAVYISGVSQRRSITLENLNLTGLGLSAVTVFNADAGVSLNNVVIHNTVVVPNGIFPFGVFGGGVFIAQSNVKFDMVDTIIMQNSAPKGGGLYCRGSAAVITMSGISGLAQNSTTGKGGGAYISEGCQFTMYSGTANPTPLSTTGVSANIADEEGGGIYVDLGAQVTLNGHEDCSQTCIGDNINPVSVNHNQSNSGVSGGEPGGGIYMTGSGTRVNIYAGLFNENLSPKGGGVYVNDFASLNVSRLQHACWDQVKCNYFNKNRTFGIGGGDGSGGAIHNEQGFVNISNSYFEENQSKKASVLFANGSNSHNTIYSSVFNHNNNQGNSDEYVIRAANSASVDIINSTFADNFIADTAVFGIAADSELRLYSSIVHDEEGAVLDVNPGTVLIDCLMAHETDSFTGSNVFLADPGFIDRNNRDYHLSPDSLAVDVCTENLLNLDSRDIDFEPRGIDSQTIDDINGVFDLGADEAEDGDLIFQDDFES